MIYFSIPIHVLALLPSRELVFAKLSEDQSARGPEELLNFFLTISKWKIFG